MGVAFVVGALVARYLGAEKMGILAYAMSIAGFLDVFIQMGTKSILTRNLVAEPDNKNIILGSGLALRGLGAIFSLIGLLLLLVLVPEDGLTLYIILIMSIPPLLVGAQILFSYFDSKVITKYDARVKLVSLVIISCFRLSLIFLFQAGLVWFAFGYVIVEFINLVGQVWIYQRGHGNVLELRVSKAYMKRLFNESWPLIFTALLTVIYMRTDQIMIKHLLNDAQTGVYFVSVRFSMIFVFIPTVIGSSLATAVYRAKKHSYEKFLQRTQELLNFLVFASFGVILVVSIAGPMLIDFIYGSDYSAAGPVLIVHVWSLLFIALGTGSSTYLMAIDLQKISLIRTIIGAIVNVLLNFLFIPKYGIIGAAYATLITQVVASYLAYLTSKRTREIFLMQTRALFLIGFVQQVASFLKKQE